MSARLGGQPRRHRSQQIESALSGSLMTRSSGPIDCGKLTNLARLAGPDTTMVQDAAGPCLRVGEQTSPAPINENRCGRFLVDSRRLLSGLAFCYARA